MERRINYLPLSVIAYILYQVSKKYIPILINVGYNIFKYFLDLNKLTSKGATLMRENDFDYTTSAYRMLYEVETLLEYNIHSTL